MPYLNKKGFWDYDTMESLAPHRFEMPYPGGRHQMRREYTREIEFSGRVYCATTETGFFVVRRCGVVWITGNSGKIFQPQNLPRGTLTPEQADTAIGAIKTGMASILYDDVNAAVSSCLRGAIMAPPGKKLVVADLSNIEGRVLAWLAGERWKLDAFRAYDRGEGVDLYKATYARTFGIKPDEVTKKQRQVGKVLELAMGYMGGVGSFLAFATVYGVDLKDLAERTYESLDQDTLIEAGGQWDFFSRKGMTNGLDERTWTALNAIKLAWRNAHPAITDFWREIEARAVIALGEYAATNRRPLPVTFSNTPFGLACRLPSGRVMAYPRAELPTDGEHCLFRYYAPLRVRKGFAMSRTHAGKIVENITQATARDVLAANLARVEAAGYKIILSVHDELITETPDTPDYTAEKLAAMMATPPAWAADLPLAAAGFEAYRYKKD
jgi:DNA polymerase